MKTSVYRFSLDVNQSQSQVSISAGKGENGVRLIIRMTENGAPFEVEDGSYAVFSAVKPDGKPVINDCAIFGNDTVVYDFTEQTVAVEGITRCQILLFGPDRSLIASARFQIVVHETIWDKGIESAEDFNVVKKFVEDINTVNDRLDKNASDIDDLADRVGVLETARAATGSFMVHESAWSGDDDNGYTATVKLPNDPLQSGDTMLILPNGEDTLKASVDAVMSVKDVASGDEEDTVVLFAQKKPVGAFLLYRYIVIKRGVGDVYTEPVASIVGVHDVPKYIKDAIEKLLSGGGGGGAANADEIINKILDPDNYPLTEDTESVSFDVALEVGKLSKSGGGERDGEGGLRMAEYQPINSFSFMKPVFDTTDGETSVTALFYTDDKTYTGKYFFIEKNKFFDLSKAPEGAAYIRCYISTEDETGSLALEFSNTTDGGAKAEHKKIYMADHGYSIYGASIDDETMHKIVVESAGKDGNTYNITEIRAPKSNPEEATLCLKNSGNGISQFVDFSSMVYNPDNPTVEIVCQTRGGKPLPVFSIGFNSGTGGRIKKLTVHPDAAPIELTSTGIIGGTPTSVDLSRFDPDENGKGYITETYGKEENAPTETTELTYDDAGNIVSIKTADGHVTELKWKEAE